MLSDMLNFEMSVFDELLLIYSLIKKLFAYPLEING